MWNSSASTRPKHSLRPHPRIDGSVNIYSMASNYYHLAQVNIGRARAPMDSPVMSGFVSQLERINALADRSPGFVWRLQTESGDATSVLPYEDPSIHINMSVWESVETLRDFVYRSHHLGVMRDRSQWFESMPEAYLALWWIPAGHIPSVAEARERLEFRRAFGDTPLAFSFAKNHPAPEAPDGDPALPSRLERPPILLGQQHSQRRLWNRHSIRLSPARQPCLGHLPRRRRPLRQPHRNRRSPRPPRYALSPRQFHRRASHRQRHRDPRNPSRWPHTPPRRMAVDARRSFRGPLHRGGNRRLVH